MKDFIFCAVANAMQIVSNSESFVNNNNKQI